MLERLFSIFCADRSCGCGQRFGLCVHSKSAAFSLLCAKCPVIAAYVHLEALLVLLCLQIMSTRPDVSYLLSGETLFTKEK